MFIKRKKKIRNLGGMAIEFALVGPIFFGLLFAGVQGGILMNQWSILQWCCDKASRDMMVSNAPNVTDMVTSAKKYEASQGYNNLMTFNASETTCGEQQCLVINGTMDYNFKIGPFDMGQYTMSSTSTAPLPPVITD